MVLHGKIAERATVFQEWDESLQTTRLRRFEKKESVRHKKRTER